jgi:hypothetical protein
MNRRTSKKSQKLLTVWIPECLNTSLALGVVKEDSDKSKFVRNAIREKLARNGVVLEETR